MPFYHSFVMPIIPLPLATKVAARATKNIPTALPYGLALGMIFILALGLCMRFLKLFFNFFIKFFPA